MSHHPNTMPIPPLPDYILSRESYTQADAYPEKLEQAEARALDDRWHALDIRPRQRPTDRVGLAISGGGIRSATFALGVLQSLAKHGLLGQFDYLSTVSGGGYIGSFWGAWLNRLPVTPGGPKAEDAPEDEVMEWLGRDFKGAEARLADSGSDQVSWLRENGRYLAPNETSDLWLAATVYQRNFATLHLVLAPLFLTWFLMMAWWSSRLCESYCWQPWHILEKYTITLGHSVTIIVNGPLWDLALALLAVATAFGVFFWFLPGSPGSKLRNGVTRLQAYTAQLFSCVLCVASLDLGGASLIGWLRSHHPVLSLSSVFAFFVAASHWFKRLLAARSTSEGEQIPPSMLLALAAGSLALLWLLCLSSLGYGIVEWDVRYGHSTGLLILLLVMIAAAMGRRTSLLNGSSLASLYAARLTRAYLGASNHKRLNHADITATIDGDQVDFSAYYPHRRGGPLHILNVTINETIDPRSAVQRNDRKGVPMAVGPCGLSVGVGHHALWASDDPTRSTVKPIPNSTGGFNVFDAEGNGHTRIEQVSLGAWVGISGAAFTTGLGFQTSKAMSFLLGFFNIRLGWWWDSGIRPGQRSSRGKRPLVFWPGDAASFLFQSQSYILNEFTASFHGTARRDWYLSDGGHFENTAAYELIRRRVGLIFVCDNGCDPQRVGDDFANLVRKARIDFAAQITVVPPSKLGAAGKELLNVAGSLDELLTTEREKSQLSKCVLICSVSYYGTTDTSILVLIKPTICGDEEAPERDYAANNKPFPQQSTINQFYGEDQWESYRALGEKIADQVFRPLSDGTPRDLIRSHFS